ncbi:hypothetical protein GGR50DRAFT_171037 [Xylaria sp. CBS 124048]|nr:hypothetical protein GGR50DRAFT_171037 [Xylaria sp. CBS 124048]
MDMHGPVYMSPKSVHIRESFSGELYAPEDRRLSASSSPCAYGSHDMASYTSISPYSTYSVSAYESSLPTPVSVVGSPPMLERSEKIMPSYDQHGGSAQQLTPPTTSRPWPYTPSMTSAAPASMTVPSSAAGMLDTHSIHASSHSPEHHTAMADPTPHFHWSTYGVSGDDGAEELSTSQSMHHSVQSSLMIESPPYGLSPSPHGPLAPSLQGAMNAHPTEMRPLMGNHIHDQFDNLSNISLEYVQTYPSRRTAKARASRSSRSAKRARTSHHGSTKSTANAYASAHAVDVATGAQADTRGSPQQSAPKYLALDAKAPEDSRYLVEVRCRMSDDKGKGMWEHIQQAYKERYGHKTKENLQMQLIRSVQSYAIWPEEEDEALRAAVKEYERRRYPEIRKIMKEKGGRRVWDWNDGSIAKRLVQMGIDEIDHQDPIKRSRRKRKSTVIPKSGGEPWVGCVNIPFNEPRELTREENELLLEAYCKTEAESSEQSRSDDTAEYQSAPTSGSLSEKQSARVAKQACDQYLAGQTESLYSGQGAHARYVS